MKIDKFFHLYETENDVIFEDVTGRVYDEEWRKMHYKSSYNQGFLEGAKLCEQAQPEQRWIPCSERLPDEKDAGILKKLGIEKRSEDVLATVEVKGERMTVTACTYDGKWDWNMKYAFPDYKVIAWMPLPEPYGDDQDDEMGS